ncbi:MAG: hypothetical protein LBF71_01045 [Campylobacteraceae bacterium]|jgi:hypothetical protein|nr:hypothetical protein [Campylobacteraceae bacterium]
MKTSINFLAAFSIVLFLTGCQSGGGSGSIKCSDSNPAYPSLQSVFPVSLFSVPYTYGGKFLGYTAIDNVTDYKQKLLDNGYSLDQDEPKYVTYALDNPFADIQSSKITIWNNDYVDWHLGGAASDIDDSLFNNTTIFPPTGTQQDLYGIDRGYAIDMTSEFDGYITELESDGFRYAGDWEGWIKESEDRCFVYLWSKNDDNESAEWSIVLKL